MRRLVLLLVLLCLLPAHANRRSALINQKPAAGGGSSLATGLVMLWKLDESSGTRVATVGGMDLTDNNSVGFTNNVPANFSGAALFDGSSDFLSHADDTSLRMGDFDDHWVAWVYTKVDSVKMIVSKDVNTSRGYIAYLALSGPKFGFETHTNSCAQFNSTVSHGTTLTVNTWNMVDWGWDKTGGGKYFVNVNAGTRADATDVSPCTSSSGQFQIGGRAYPGFEQRWNGAICYVMRWNRILTPSELTQLYNSGAGLPYPF